jgi:type II secretory ATPase GspE/PulE/Tfp pilus assembly ATPase PilB-like protein
MNMPHHIPCLRSRRSPTRRFGRPFAALLSALALLSSGSLALAQTTAAEPDSGRYMSGFWLAMFILQCAVWIGVFDWIGRDSERLGMRHTFWSSLVAAVGGAGMVLMIGVSIVFVFTSILGLVAVLAVYIWKRNLALPPEQKVLTRAHFDYLVRRLCERLHLKPSRGAAIQSRSRHEDATTIELLRKDGTSLEQLTDARSGSEAVISIKELVESAILSRATDIHLEPKENELQARFRIDGILHNVPSYATELALPMISCVKVLSDMDIAEKRKPLDGSFMGRLSGRTLDFRVATAPCVHGETMAIRILDRDAGLIRLEKLGMLPDHIALARRIIQYPHGMLIVSGPTGSGKSTTLYAMLSEIDAYQKNIITIEDPIEYRLDNVTQTPINPKAGITFASSLRSSLRQDPDVIMVGEIRDAETARVACQAAMTGHFVFTTLHANDSVTSLFRLLDLGVESYFIAASLSAVLAQRLCRVLCPTCKEAYVPEPDFFKSIGLPPGKEVQLYKSVGCEECQGTGYRGRIGVFELLDVTDGIKDLLRTSPGVQAITAEAKKTGFRKLHEDGLAKVIKGLTSVKELLRITR